MIYATVILVFLIAWAFISAVLIIFFKKEKPIDKLKYFDEDYAIKLTEDVNYAVPADPPKPFPRRGEVRKEIRKRGLNELNILFEYWAGRYSGAGITEESTKTLEERISEVV